MSASLVGSEMCIRDSTCGDGRSGRPWSGRPRRLVLRCPATGRHGWPARRMSSAEATPIHCRWPARTAGRWTCEQTTR
eukprot:12478143-Alexandrium_andersonii.AAC.1